MNNYPLSITQLQLLKLLKQLSLEDAKEAAHILTKRIQLLESSQRPAPPQTELEKLPFTIRTLNVLKDNELFTVDDLTHIGLKRLLMQKGVGQKTVQEIKEVVGLQ